jgi:hypothetical protein
MQRKALGTAIALVLLAALAAGQAPQAQEDYLDVYSVQVKPDKRADFDAITKKMVAANSQHNGDNWVAMETVYGPGDRVTFISTRQSYGDIEKATGTFYAAMQKAYGKAIDKVFQDFSQCLVSTRSEIRRRRWDLSSNAPADPAAMAKLVGDSRWLRTTVVHVRPGQGAAFEALLKDIKAAREKASPPQTVLVSQAVAGQEGGVFYVTTLQSSLGAFDALPSIQETLGAEGYEKFLKASADTVSGSETVINRFLPSLSNASEQIASAAPDYWKPKAAAAPVKAKASGTKAPVVPAKSTTKVEEKEE